jgi:plasmid stabilization system protein ParE
MYKLSYLPLFETDLDAARRYIALKLRNPDAANKLMRDTESAILKRLAAPEVFEMRHIGREREHACYRIPVLNFAVWYVVIGNVMEVRRFLYGRRKTMALLREDKTRS